MALLGEPAALARRVSIRIMRGLDYPLFVDSTTTVKCAGDHSRRIFAFSGVSQSALSRWHLPIKQGSKAHWAASTHAALYGVDTPQPAPEAGGYEEMPAEWSERKTLLSGQHSGTAYMRTNGTAATGACEREHEHDDRTCNRSSPFPIRAISIVLSSETRNSFVVANDLGLVAANAHRAEPPRLTTTHLYEARQEQTRRDCPCNH